MSIDWTPLPGHYTGQPNAHVRYVDGEYRGMICEMRQTDTGHVWSFYDPTGGPEGDPDMPIAYGEPFTNISDAEADLVSYIDSYLHSRVEGRS